MTQNNIDDILNLLAATIFADKRVVPSEVNVFAKEAAKLDVLPNLSEAKLLAWYEANKDIIRAKMSTPYFKDWFYDLLDKTSDVTDKKPLLSVMRKISNADNQIHVSERALFTLAARHWGVGSTR